MSSFIVMCLTHVILIIANINLPSPIVFPSDGKYKHLAGEDLELNCTIYGYTQIRLVDWSYPAQNCDNQPSNSCLVSITLSPSRVSIHFKIVFYFSFVKIVFIYLYIMACIGLQLDLNCIMGLWI